MSRRARKFKRTSKNDAKYNNLNIGRFINKIMKHGKKSIAEKIVYEALNILAEKTSTPQDEAFEVALKNIQPLMEVKSRRVGGSTYQVPVEVKKDRGTTLAMRWIIANSRNRTGAMAKNLAGELVDGFNKTGASIKKREDTHKMAEANKAFAHFRW